MLGIGVRVCVQKEVVSIPMIPDGDLMEGGQVGREGTRKLQGLQGRGKIAAVTFLISQESRRLGYPTGMRGEPLPSETRSPQVSSITSWYRTLWSRSSCPHSSWVKVTATSLKVTKTFYKPRPF